MCACVVLSEIKVDLRFVASAEAFMDQTRQQVARTSKPFLRGSDLNEKTRLSATGTRAHGPHIYVETENAAATITSNKLLFLDTLESTLLSESFGK